jgi:hypothetical protein
MHEHGLMRALLARADAEARARGGALRGLRARLGALWAGDAEHFRRDLEHARVELGLRPLRLEVELDPERASGVELIEIEVGPA